MLASGPLVLTFATRAAETECECQNRTTSRDNAPYRYSRPCGLYRYLDGAVRLRRHSRAARGAGRDDAAFYGSAALQLSDFGGAIDHRDHAVLHPRLELRHRLQGRHAA